ncbi:MAG: ATP-binding protein [Paracoccaceae bacterium]
MISLQLIVGLVFINRHFAGVTKQMTESVVLELNHIIDQVRAEGGAPLADLAQDFGLTIALSDAPLPEVNLRQWFDLSGRVLIDEITAALKAPVRVDLTRGEFYVRLVVDSGDRRMVIDLPRSRVTARNAHQLLVLMIFASILLILISVAFLRLQTRPIRRLAEVSSAFGKGQVLPITPSGAEEVRRAIFAFLAMRTRLERQMGQRTAMLSSISHDLRTPLTRLKLAAEFLEENEDTIAMRRDLAEMEAMLDAFLAFAKGEAADDLLQTDTQALADGVIEATRRGLPAKGAPEVTMQVFNPTAETPITTMRSGVVERAVQNLVNNALRYGTRVRLTLRLLPKAVEFVVEDNGPGIAETDRTNAIRPFTRLDEARNQNKGGGVGLGLSIATDAARSHGGALELGVSIELGGLRACLRLPR